MTAEVAGHGVKPMLRVSWMMVMSGGMGAAPTSILLSSNIQSITNTLQGSA
jgi:hypothetical protein